MEYYPRKIEERLEEWLNRKEVLLIKGPRQSGKTTLLLHLKEKLNANYVTLEDESMLKTFENAPNEFAKRFIAEKKSFLFIDEAQYSKKAGKIIKLLYDIYADKIKLIVTGSGSFDIKVEIGKYLVGRAIYFELAPLDFEEFIMWKAKNLHKTFLEHKKSVKDFISNGKEIRVKPAFEQEFNLLLNEYLIFGGYPAIVKEEDKEIKKQLLKNLTRTYLEKDIFFFLNIRHIDKLRDVLNYLSFNTSSLLEVSSVMRELKIDYKTIVNYLSILSSTYIISLISPFYKNLATELKKSKKVYFNDMGLRNSIMDNFVQFESRTDKGILLENFILNELKSNFDYKINYWRTTSKAEVDFVLNLEREIVPIEVKSKTKLAKSFLSFIKTYKSKKALVFTEREFGTKKIDDVRVAFIPHFFV